MRAGKPQTKPRPVSASSTPPSRRSWRAALPRPARSRSRRARVSKRELYALVGSKQDMLVACIGAPAKPLQVPADLPEPHDREPLSRVLTAFGTQLLREVSDPTVVAVFQLAIAEAVRAPEVARTLHTVGVETGRAALREIMTRAQSARLLSGKPIEMAEHFSGLLWGNLMMSLLLRVTDRPSLREIARRASAATAAFLQLYPQPNQAETAHAMERPRG